jgi:uncharacterized protein (DUF305 family)
MRGTAFHRAVMLAGVAGITALALVAGCGSGNDVPGMGHGSGTTAATTPAASGAAFNDADVAFAQNMIPHHRQAVRMADLVATRARDPEIKQLATQIKAAQDPEIKTLTGWLTAWGKPVEPPQGHGGHAMPGMMSDAEMTRLMAAQGMDFDRMFAQMMIAHHNGAILMAREEKANGASTDAKALAVTIERTQADEVSRLDKILDRL